MFLRLPFPSTPTSFLYPFSSCLTPVFPLRFPKPSGIWPQKSGPRDLFTLSDYWLRLSSRLPTLESAGFLTCVEVTWVSLSLVRASKSPAIFMEDVINHRKRWAWAPTLAHKSSVFPGQYIPAFYGDLVQQLWGAKAEGWHPASSGMPHDISQSFIERTLSICSAGIESNHLCHRPH